jgi:hypothetical protein
MVYKKDKIAETDMKAGLILLALLLAVLITGGCQCKTDEGNRSDVKQLVCTE